VLVPITHQLRNAFSKIPPTAVHLHCSWWVFGTSTLQLVDYWNKHFAVGGFSQQALSSFWIFGTSTSKLVDFLLGGVDFFLYLSRKESNVNRMKE